MIPRATADEAAAIEKLAGNECISYNLQSAMHGCMTVGLYMNFFS